MCGFAASRSTTRAVQNTHTHWLACCLGQSAGKPRQDDAELFLKAAPLEFGVGLNVSNRVLRHNDIVPMY